MCADLVEVAVSQPLLPPPTIPPRHSSSLISEVVGSNILFMTPSGLVELAQLFDHKAVSHIAPDTLRASCKVRRTPRSTIWTFGCLVKCILRCCIAAPLSFVFLYPLGLLVQVYEFMFGVPISSRKHNTIESDNNKEELPPDLVKTYKLASQFLDMQTGVTFLP